MREANKKAKMAQNMFDFSLLQDDEETLSSPEIRNKTNDNLSSNVPTLDETLEEVLDEIREPRSDGCCRDEATKTRERKGTQSRLGYDHCMIRADGIQAGRGCGNPTGSGSHHNNMFELSATMAQVHPRVLLNAAPESDIGASWEFREF